MCAKVAVGADYRYWFAKETTFGTAVAANVTFIPTEGFVINRDLKSHVIPRATGYRMQSEDASWQDTNGAIPDVTMSFYVSPDSSKLFPAVLQSSAAYTLTTSAVLSAYVTYTNLPDFSANQGYFYTIQAEGPAQLYNERLISAVGKSLKLSVGPDSNEGCLYAEMGFVAKDSTINAANRTGTDVVPSLSALYKWNTINTFSVSGKSYLSSLYDFELNIMNNAKPIPFGGGANVALPKIEGNGSFKLIGSDASASALKNLCASNRTGNGLSTILRWGTGGLTAVGDMIINCNINLTNYTVERTIDGEETVTYEYILTQDGSVPATIGIRFA